MNQMKWTTGVFVLLMFTMMVLPEVYAEPLTDKKWSFDFENVSILDAFSEIQRQTGIKFVVNQKTTEPIRITCHARNQSIAQIQGDLLKNLNHAVSMHYGSDEKLESIHITIIGQGDGNAALTGSASMNPPPVTTESKNQKTGFSKPQTHETSGAKPVRSQLARPPEPPKINGLESPPLPPPPGF